MNKEQALEHIYSFAESHPVVLGTAVELISRIPRITIENPQFLREAREWLKQGTIVVQVAPHTRTMDLPMIERVKRKYGLAGLLSRCKTNAWPASGKFFQYDWLPEMKPIERKSFRAYAALHGIDLYPVAQWYLITDENRNEADKLNRKSSKMLRRDVKKVGSEISVFPEETRGTTGGLLRPPVDVLAGLSKKAPVKVLPLIPIGVDKMQGRDNKGLDGMNPFVKIHIRAGLPLTYDQAEEYASRFRWKESAIQRYHWRELELTIDFTVTDAFMLNLANYHPPKRVQGANPRGVYAWKNIQVVA